MTASRFRPDGDACLSIFREVYETGALVFPPRAHVLEVGCAEADWMTPMLAVRPDLTIIGIDWRPTDRPGLVIRGDVLAQEFPVGTFDVVVGISSIEHVGLGHYEHDPLDPDGDTHCLALVARWLKPGGWVYLDVPYDARGFCVEGTAHRCYDDAAVQARLLVPGLTLRQHWFTGEDGAALQTPPVPVVPGGAMRYVALYATKD